MLALHGGPPGRYWSAPVRRVLVIAALYGAAIGGCRTRPRPVYEYEPTITTTWTGDAPPAPAATSESLPAAPTTPVPHAPAWRRGEAR